MNLEIKQPRNGETLRRWNMVCCVLGQSYRRHIRWYIRDYITQAREGEQHLGMLWKEDNNRVALVH